MYNLSFLTDEYSSMIEEVIEYAIYEQIHLLELRTICGKNVVDFSLESLKKIAKKIRDAKLFVSCLASPLLKWYPDHISKLESSNIRLHTFQYQKSEKKNIYKKVFEIADIFQTKYIRVFSFLKYPQFKDDELDGEFEILIKFAEEYDKILLVENEPVCNIDTLRKLYQFLARINHMRVRALFDIGNLYELGYCVQLDELVNICPYLEYLHLKDFSSDTSGYTVIGHGDVDFKEYFTSLNNLKLFDKVIFSVETHVNGEKKRATDLSIKYVRNLLEKLSGKKDDVRH